MQTFQQRIVKAWHARCSWVIVFYPVSLLFRLMASLRRFILRSLYQGRQFGCPVVVVGNISVGGCGKTPLLISMANQLIARGLRVAILSRGYGGSSDQYPLQVQRNTGPELCGDEPLLIKHSLPDAGCMVVVDPDRRRGVNFALANFKCDLVLCDDGLQHYRLHRDAEIVVVDGARGFGNKLCLPAGPLREPIDRLKSVDIVVVNGEYCLDDSIAIDSSFHIRPIHFRNLSTGKLVSIENWSGSKTVHALAAIGNPRRFANTLESLGFEVMLLGFDDHSLMSHSDLTFEDNYPVIITAKDAVKFTKTDLDHVWVLEVEAMISDKLVNTLLDTINLN